MLSKLQSDHKRWLYMKVLVLLCVLTVFELGVASSTMPKLIVTLLVVSASLSKAFGVGWVYMHLNHETKGLRVVLLFPLFVAFFYAVFLIYDSHVTERRHAHAYVEQPKRFFGQRRLKDRKIDEFGNTVVEVEAPVHHGEEHGEEHKTEANTSPDEAKPTEGGQSKTTGEPHGEAPAAAGATAPGAMAPTTK